MNSSKYIAMDVHKDLNPAYSQLSEWNNKAI